jgi:hypothetical protein
MDVSAKCWLINLKNARVETAITPMFLLLWIRWNCSKPRSYSSGIEPDRIVKYLKRQEIKRQSKPVFKIFFHRFSVFYNMLRPTWPSACTSMYGLRGRRLATYSIIKRNEISLFYINCSHKKGTAAVLSYIFASFRLYQLRCSAVLCNITSWLFGRVDL